MLQSPLTLHFKRLAFALAFHVSSSFILCLLNKEAGLTEYKISRRATAWIVNNARRASSVYRRSNITKNSQFISSVSYIHRMFRFTKVSPNNEINIGRQLMRAREMVTTIFHIRSGEDHVEHTIGTRGFRDTGFESPLMQGAFTPSYRKMVGYWSKFREARAHQWENLEKYCIMPN